MKGFVGTAVLYLPNSFYAGGFGFSSLALFGSALLTMWCSTLLLKVKAIIGAKSYADIGMKCFGAKGKLFTNILLAFSQFGFCCGYVYFIVENVYNIKIHITGGSKPENEIGTTRWIIGIACVVFFSLLSFVRKIAVFAKAHLWSNLMIIITLTSCIVAGSIAISRNGN